MVGAQAVRQTRAGKGGVVSPSVFFCIEKCRGVGREDGALAFAYARPEPHPRTQHRQIAEAKPPQMAELAQRIAASLPGAITYSAKALLNAKLKVLTVDGKAAGTPGYAIK